MAIRNNKPILNKEKSEAVILYLLNKLPGLTEEKLACLLYFIDMDWYEREEEFFMGFTYIKNK